MKVSEIIVEAIPPRGSKKAPIAKPAIVRPVINKPTVKKPAIVAPTIKRKAHPKLEDSALGSYLENTAKAAGIVGAELAALLAQCKVETMNFFTLEELPNAYQADYEPVIKVNPTTKKPEVTNPTAKTIGNTRPGDGQRYKGRGFIHLTGRYNYETFAKESGIPIDKNPELLKDPATAAKSAIWFWQHRVKPNVSNVKSVPAVTKLVNGPRKLGLKERTIAFQNYLKKLSGKV